MPSINRKNAILKEYENLFCEPKVGFFTKLFSKSKNFPSNCKWCGISNINIKNRESHHKTCKKFQIIWISKLASLSRIAQSKLTNDILGIEYLNSYVNEFTQYFERESVCWETKYGKSLKSSVEIDIKNFQFIKPLTKGGYGQVFLCKDSFSGEYLATKVLSISEAIQKSSIDAYVNERENLLRCRSQHIISLYYSFKSEFFLYQIMEYASGGDVSSLLECSGRFSQIIAKNVAVHLLLALKDLKAIQIVHGDVKLENLMYCPDSGIIKLGDFGLSFPSTSDGNVSKSALGTPEYMAPEQIKYSKKGYFSDMWSVGICIYEMIFGIPPFYGESAEQIMHKIAESLDRSTNYLYFENSVEISSQCEDLICGLLDPNYLTRLTLEQAMKHEFFDFVDWNAPVSISLPEVKDPFMERNKRFNSLQFYNMQTIGTEVVSFQDGIFNQQTSLKNQLLLLKLFPIKNLNKIQE